MDDKKIREYYETLSRERNKFIKKAVAQEKHFWSAWYRWSFKYKLMEFVRREIKINPPRKILDVGCGFGGDYQHICKENFSGYGIDFSLSQLKLGLANENLGSIRFIQAEVDGLPFKDSTFDVVIFSEVIEHLQDCRKALAEIRRVLKDSGHLFITTPNRFDYFHFLGNLFPVKFRKRIKRLIQLDADIDSSKYSEEIEEHVHIFSLRELLAAVKNSGFSIEEVHGGHLSVPIPKLFDRYRFLQTFWEVFDNFISRLPFSGMIKSNFILILKNDQDSRLDEGEAIAQMDNVFGLSEEIASREISTAFHTLFHSFFTDRFKFMKYFKSTRLVFDLVRGRGKVILDAGCGFGLTSVIFSSLGAKKVYAIDFSKEEIAGFRGILSKLPSLDNLEVRQMDCQKMDYPDNFFDVVYARDSICHIHDLEVFLAEVRRVLKKEGLFYIYDSDSSLCIFHGRYLRRYWKTVEYGPLDPAITLDKPFSLMRREMVLEYAPGVTADQLEYLVKATQGMYGEQIKSAVRDYLATGRLKRKKGFKYVDPRSGMQAEKPVNPFALKKMLARYGFKARLLAPFFYITYPALSYPLKSNSGEELAKSVIKKMIRFTFPLSLLTTPRFEILAVNEKI